MPVVTAVVVSYNHPGLLRRCLDALLAQRGVGVEVVVVDNASPDPGIAALAPEYPDVRWRFHPANVGFGAACNAGVAEATTEYVVTLNPDVELEPGCLEALVAVAVDSPHVGMVAATLLKYDQPTLVDSMGIAVDRAGIAWERHAGRPLAAVPGEQSTPPLLGPVGAVALFRRAVFADIGGFDPTLFLYHEDTDLAWRARNAGWECALAPAALARHHHSAASGRESPLTRYYLARNKLLVVLANYPVPALYAYLPVILGYDALAAAWYVSPLGPRAPLASRWALVRGRLAALRLLPSLIARRRERRRFRRRFAVVAWRCRTSRA